MNGFGLVNRWSRAWHKLKRIPCPECQRPIPLTRPVRDLHLLRCCGWKRTTWRVKAVRPAKSDPLAVFV